MDFAKIHHRSEKHDAYVLQLEKLIATQGGVIDEQKCILVRGKLSIAQAEASLKRFCKDVRGDHYCLRVAIRLLSFTELVITMTRVIAGLVVHM